MKIKKCVWLGIMILALSLAVWAENEKPAWDATSDSFYEKARLIMTPEEISIFKHLPDEASKQEFITDFWLKRDPTPDTDENENKIEFGARIEYANKWFKEGSKDRGWDTERGRLYLVLGMPDQREWGEAALANYGGMLSSNKRTPMEVWLYYRLAGGLTLIFAETDDTGKLRLQKIPTNLQSAMDAVKFSLDLRDKSDLKHAFKFEVKFQDEKILVKVPTKKVNFEEKDGKMNMLFDITAYIYLNSVKIDTLHISKPIQMDPDSILNQKNFEFDVPYPLTKKGKYLFDIVIEDKNAGKKYRSFMNYKQK